MDAVMKRFIEGESRGQSVLFPERLDDYIGEDNPVRAIDVFVDELDLKALGFDGSPAIMRSRSVKLASGCFFRPRSIHHIGGGITASLS